MLNRRHLLAGLAATGAALPLRAQVFPPAGHGTPLGTAPFGPEVFRERRQRLMQKLGGGVAVLFGAGRVSSNSAVDAPFYQDPDFAWLTGIVDEPDAALILAPGERDIREYLFLRARDVESERWDVERLPLGSEMERRTGFPRVMRGGAMGGMLAGIASRAKELHFLGPVVGPDAPMPRALELYGRVAQRVPGTKITDNSKLLTQMRMVKEPRELQLIRAALAATARGHLAGMRGVRPGATERQLTAIIENGFREGGGEGLAYNSIVGTGRNAASLHYTGGNAPIRAGELVLVDAGATVGGYATDITRTFPASGRFIPAQREAYDLVLRAQDAAVARLRAGAYFHDVQEAARDVFRRAGRIDQFIHGLGHQVGLHVHDAFDPSVPLPAGAVLTIEPGLYAQADNLGIRVEDMYLVTPTGAERMSTAIPRTADEIERAMAGARRG